MVVAPLAGAWIEIRLVITEGQVDSVAPLAGAWIEIEKIIASDEKKMSLPSRGRGLKFI